MIGPRRVAVGTPLVLSHCVVQSMKDQYRVFPFSPPILPTRPSCVSRASKKCRMPSMQPGNSLRNALSPKNIM